MTLMEDDMLALLSIRQLFILIPLVLFLHEMEEWNIVKFHKSNYDMKIDETNLSERLWLFILSLIGLLFSIVCINISSKIISCSLFLVLVTFLIVNGLQHLLLSAVMGKYNPGFIFGGVFGTVLGVYFDIKLIVEGIIPLWIFVTINIIWFVPTVIDTIISRKENKLPNMIVQILRFSRFVERKLSE
jgi:hypothetical protein